MRASSCAVTWKSTIENVTHGWTLLRWPSSAHSPFLYSAHQKHKTARQQTCFHLPSKWENVGSAEPGGFFSLFFAASRRHSDLICLFKAQSKQSCSAHRLEAEDGGLKACASSRELALKAMSFSLQRPAGQTLEALKAPCEILTVNNSSKLMFDMWRYRVIVRFSYSHPKNFTWS